jgi:hypothetical protein
MGPCFRRDDIGVACCWVQTPVFVLRSRGTNRGRSIRSEPPVNKQCMRRDGGYFLANSITWFSPALAS